jgi:tungstate transport system substrate-binding protein
MESMTLSTTTSTFDSGLLSVIVPIFEKANHVKVKIVSVGTGQSIAIAQKGDADCVLVHARALEDKFMNDGFGTFRFDVMYNDFIIIGPKSDPAGIKSTKTAIEAFQKIASTQSTFISRGDKSGTNVKELDVWKAAGIEPKGTWYVSAGQGMGAVLLMADEKQAYTLTDRATYLKYMKDKKIQLVILNEGSKTLLNPYGVIPVSPAKFPGLNSKMADRFAYFITGIPGQTLIGDFGKKDFGASLFFPDSDEYKAYLKTKAAK